MATVTGGTPLDKVQGTTRPSKSTSDREWRLEVDLRATHSATWDAVTRFARYNGDYDFRIRCGRRRVWIKVWDHQMQKGYRFPIKLGSTSDTIGRVLRSTVEAAREARGVPSC
jgi:hypothetical protein